MTKPQISLDSIFQELCFKVWSVGADVSYSDRVSMCSMLLQNIEYYGEDFILEHTGHTYTDIKEYLKKEKIKSILKQGKE